MQCGLAKKTCNDILECRFPDVGYPFYYCANHAAEFGFCGACGQWLGVEDETADEVAVVAICADCGIDEVI